MPVELALASGGEVFASLSQQGILLSRPQSKKVVTEAAEDADYTDRIYVIDQLGWVGSVYARPGRKLPRTVDGLPVHVALGDLDSGWERGGIGRTWFDGLKPFLHAQPLLTFSLCCGFAALAEPFLPSLPENAMFEYVGPSSIGKTTILLLPCSIYGSPAAFMKTWATTVAGLEPTMRQHSGALLPLDESGHFINAGGDAAKQLAEAILMLARGRPKARYNQPAGPNSQFVVMSNGNRPIADILKHLDPATKAALQVRMITIPADAGRGLGVWHALPEGYSSSNDAIVALSELLSTHHGWAAHRFLSGAETCLADDVGSETARRQVARWIRSFLKNCKVGRQRGEEHRVAVKFAHVYAAGRLAKMWGALPATNIQDAMLTAYRAHQKQAQSSQDATRHASGFDQLEDYCRGHQKEFIRLKKAAAYPVLSDQEVATAAGFIRAEHGNAVSLNLSSEQWAVAFGRNRIRVLRELMQTGRLIARSGRQRQIKVRQNKPTDRLYSVIVDAEWLNRQQSD